MSGREYKLKPFDYNYKIVEVITIIPALIIGQFTREIKYNLYTRKKFLIWYYWSGVVTTNYDYSELTNYLTREEVLEEILNLQKEKNTQIQTNISYL